ncbi:hypothetical protein [Denitrificimonas caeni]|uniref:hypothetical protein n=1 Tax=Denitrificimonas caeni TaxID=521720 RepID=UPI001965816C|nr:hypothetical protein [Denitrificimonas caeni]
MNKTKKITTLAIFREADNVLTHITESTYRVNGKLAQNSDLDSICTQVINLLTHYLDENYIDHGIAIRLDSTVNTEDYNNVPLNISILAEPESSDDISDDIKSILHSVVVRFIESVLSNRGDIFATNSPDKPEIFTPAQSDLIDEYSNNFINKYRGKSISKPFVCLLSGEKTIEIPVQGTFKSPVTQSAGIKNDEVFLAHSDGAKGSEMLVFLRRVGATNKLASGPTREFIAEKDSHTKTASAAFANSSPLVKVVSYEKTDSKGRIRFYLKDISKASMEDLEAFKLELTD